MKSIATMCALGLLCPRLCLAAQVPDTLTATRGDPENLSFALESDAAALAELETLCAMMENPVELNTATVSELMLVPGIDRALALRVLDSLSRRRVASVTELGHLGGMNRRALSDALPFITAEDPRRASSLSGSVRLKAEATLSERPGEPLNARGSRWKTLGRVTLQQKRAGAGLAVKAALVMEKDAGEPRVLDHVSAFLWLSPARGFELTAGDFAIEGALGLTFGAWSRSSVAAAATGGLAWKSLVARPAASAAESGGLRGALASYRSGSIEAALFYSNRAVHARLDSSSAVTSFYQAGLFRTQSEEALRSRTRERALGGRLSAVIARALRLGASAAMSKFLHPVAAAAGERHSSVLGLDALVTIGRAELGAEFVRDGRGPCAFAAAIELRLSPELQVRAAARRVETNFLSLHGQASDRAGGHSLAALGLSGDLTRTVRLELHCDRRKDLGKGPGGLALMQGNVASRLELDVPGPLAVTLQARAHFAQESVTTPDQFGRSIRVFGTGRTQSARICLEFQASASLRLVCACDLRSVRDGSSARAERALAIMHTLSWQAAPWMELEVRASSYSTDSYASRLYRWERTVRGSFGQTLLYGMGVRYSAYLRLGLGKALACEAFFSETDRALESETGGRLLLEQHERRTLSCQLEVRF